MKVKFVYYHGTRATYVVNADTGAVIEKYKGYTPVEHKKHKGYYAIPQIVKKCPI